MKASKWAPKPETSNPPPPAAETSPATPEVKAEPPSQPEPPAVEASSAPPPAQTTYDYNYADPSIDPFAQTAGTDDLFFDDDFTPVAEPIVEPTPVDTQPPEPVESLPPGGLAQSQHIPRGPSNGEVRGRGRGRGRGEKGRAERGRGGRGRGRGGAPPADAREKKDEAKDGVVKDSEEASETRAPPAENTGMAAAETPATPSGPKDPTKPTTSVRGDRTLTGGPQRTRLTEAQLSEKLAAMRSKNESLQAAHARAEADQLSFEAREAAAAKQNAERKKQQAERAKLDRQNRQQMMGEREQNRLRKLEGMKGREWDLEKEDGFAGTGEEKRRGAARGAHGGVAPSSRPPTNDPPEHASDDPTRDDALGMSPHRGRGRGRGGRGPRGGRGGRGEYHGAATPAQKADQVPPSASDFPDLPQPTSSAPKDGEAPKKLDFPNKSKTADVKSSDPRPGVKKQESFGLPSPMDKGKSWADQVEGS